MMMSIFGACVLVACVLHKNKVMHLRVTFKNLPVSIDDRATAQRIMLRVATTRLWQWQRLLRVRDRARWLWFFVLFQLCACLDCTRFDIEFDRYIYIYIFMIECWYGERIRVVA